MEEFTKISGGLIKTCAIFAPQTEVEIWKNLNYGCVIFATSVIESSYTFPRVKYVIDTRKVSLPTFNYKTQIHEYLEYEASPIHRKGRLGRVNLESNLFSLLRSRLLRAKG